MTTANTSPSIFPIPTAAKIAGIFQYFSTVGVGSLQLPTKENKSKIKFNMITDESGKMNLSPTTQRDELDRILDSMSEDERWDLIMSLAGSRPDLEEDTDEDWGFFDWNASDDLSV